MDSRTEKVTFRGAQGHTLDARLDLPAHKPVAYALFAHCFTCSSNLLAVTRISRALTEHGLAVLRFDFTGLGSSEGEFANTNFSTNVADLVAAAGHLRQTREAPRLLIGHSLGGAAVLRAATQLPEVKAVATLNAPYEPGHVRGLLSPVLQEVEEKGEAELRLGGRSFRITRQFLEDIAEQRMEDTLRNLGRALMVMHSPVDTVVGMENARRIYEGARHPKSFVALDGADHLLTQPEDARFVAAMLGAWAGRYVGAPEVERQHEAQPALDRGVIEVREAGEGRYAQDIRVGRHELRADEPVEYGGNDTGPSPYGLLAAALGACTSMTLRMYAGRKQWPLQRVTVRLRHEKIHAEDCQGCETKQGKMDRIDRALVLEGPLDEEQRQRLLEIAVKCPVHRTLESEVQVRTTLDREPG